MKYHSADMSNYQSSDVPKPSGDATLIRLQPLPQSSKLRGPGSGSDDDLSIVDDTNNVSASGPDNPAAQTHKKNVTKVKAGSIIVVN